MPDTYDHITLMCRLKAAQRRNKELESGERYIQLEELHQKEYNVYEHKIEKLKKELAACSLLQLIKKKQLQEQIQELQEQIEDRKDYMQSIARMCGFTSAVEYEEAKADFGVKYKDYKKMSTAVEQIQKDNQQLEAEYTTEMKKVQPDAAEEFSQKRADVRKEMETATKAK